MPDFDSLRLISFDHLELAVANLDRATDVFLRLGFEKVGSRELLERKLSSHLLVQNQIAIVLSSSALPTDPVAQFVAKHGDGVCDVAFLCEDAVSTLEVTMNRGAEVAQSPRSYKRDSGEVTHATIKAFGDVEHTFISRKGNLFDEGFESAYKPQSKGFGLDRIDHVTYGVEAGQLEPCSEFYQKIFGLKPLRPDVSGTSPVWQVLQSPTGNLTLPIHEPSEAFPQIQEFLSVHHGPGVQHVALETAQIVSTMRSLRQAGLPFPETSTSYYEGLLERVPGISENLGELQELGILADGDKGNYLLHAFTGKTLGALCFEPTQRKGSSGIGEGNFCALAEAIRLDRARRGILQ